jgi:hypothetical protein
VGSASPAGSPMRSRAERIAGRCAAAGDRVGELRARLAGMSWRLDLYPKGWLADLRALVEEVRPAIEQDGDPAAMAALEYAAGYLDDTRCRNATGFAAFTHAMQYAAQAGDLWFETAARSMVAACIRLGPTPRIEALRWLEDAEAQTATFQPRLQARKAGVLPSSGASTKHGRCSPNHCPDERTRNAAVRRHLAAGRMADRDAGWPERHRNPQGGPAGRRPMTRRGT